MNETPRARLIAYSVAVLAPAISLLVRWPLWAVLGDYLPHMTFLPAVALAAYYGGLRPGLLATILCAVAADSFLLSTEPADEISYTQLAGGFCLFVMTGVILSVLSESLHRARAASWPTSAAMRSRFRASAMRSSQPTATRELPS